MSGRIIRVIMFKIPAKENQLKMAELYKTLSATAIKVPLSISFLYYPNPFLPLNL
jgi:hypothetical protein